MDALMSKVKEVLAPLGFTVCEKDEGKLQVSTPYFPVIITKDKVEENAVSYMAIIPFEAFASEAIGKCYSLVEEKNKEFKSVNIFHTIEEDNICISFFPPPIDYFEDGELESPGIIQLMKQFMVFLFEATSFLYLLTDPKSLTPITHEEWIVGVNGFLDICTDWDQWAILMFKQILAIRKCEPGKTVFHKLGIGNQMCVASKHLEVYFKRCRKGLAVRMRLHWQPRIGCGQGFDCTIQLGSSPINRVIHDDFMHYLNLIVQFLIVTVCDKLQWNVGHVAVKPGAWDAILDS